MMLQRLIWCALVAAFVVGSFQTIFQQFQAVPIILAAEQFEGQKFKESSAPAGDTGKRSNAHSHGSDSAADDHHHHDAESQSTLQRSFWTWIANFLHAFGIALIFFAVMVYWFWRRGGQDAAVSRISVVALATAVAGWMSLSLWPSLGLPAEIPGMQAAALGERQLWWVLASICSAMACVVIAFSRSPWRWLPACLLLILPFIVGAPHPIGDPFAGFTGEALTQLNMLAGEFIWASRWLALSFWLSLGVVGGVLFKRWLLAAIGGANRSGVDDLSPSLPLER